VKSSVDNGERRPLAGRNFRVEIDEGNGRRFEIGCSEVVLPQLGAPHDPWQPAAAEPLLLRRAATGGAEFHAWWDKARHGRAPQRRTVHITLLGDDLASEPMHWRFRNARPVSLHYSPLNAMGNALLIETLALVFDDVEIG
jgi:hypothetical protein